MPPRRPDPLLERALMESQLKLGPQGQMLRQMLTELAGGYSRTRKVNASNEVGIKAATQQARPDVARAFETALSSVTAQRAALGASDEPQASAYQRRVSEQRANALNDLSQREVRATEGRIYANQAARDEYLGGKAKIQGQMLDLAEQAGMLTAATLAQLKEERRRQRLEDRRIDVTESQARETRRHNRVAEATAQQNADTTARNAARAGRGKRKGKVQWATPQQHGQAKSEIEKAAAQINILRGKVKSRSKLIQILINGAPKGKDKDGSDLPAIPAFDADYVRAAMNLVFDGSLSRGDLQRLHNRGLQLRRLGYAVRPPQGPRTPRGAAGVVARGGGGSLSSRPPVPGLSR